MILQAQIIAYRARGQQGYYAWPGWPQSSAPSGFPPAEGSAAAGLLEGAEPAVAGPIGPIRQP